MSSTFRNSGLHEPGSSRWGKFAPHRLAFNGYLLVDDCIHRTINRPAEWVERKTGINRFTTCCGVLGLGVISDVAISRYSSSANLGFHLMVDGVCSALAVSNLWVQLYRSSTVAEGIGPLGDLNRLRKSTRLLYFIVGIGIMSSAYAINDYGVMGSGSFLTSWTTRLYLSSSSNGTINGFTDFVKSAWRKLVTALKPSPTPVPETGLREPEPSG